MARNDSTLFGDVISQNITVFDIYPEWYLAEGTTGYGFDTRISIVNPNDGTVNADITYMTDTGPVSGETVQLPAWSQATVYPKETLGERDFSTKVVCKEGKNICVDRTMTWAGEVHSSVGVTSPGTTWYLPEGSSGWGFECWLLIQNPNSDPATCKITYMLSDGTPVEKPVTISANTRATFNMAEHIGEKDASIKITSDKPVIPERAMYRNGRREGHCSAGTRTPAVDYYLAEGTTAWGFTTYVLVQNPNGSPASVTVTYMTPNGPKEQPAFEMPANSRRTIRVNDIPEVSNTDLSIHVSGTLPIIAERAMYWDNGTGEACHDSIGVSFPHKSFFLPDGETSRGWETWTLVQNPNSTAVTVEIAYLTPTGEGNQVFTDEVPADSRKTYNMADKIPEARAAITVKSTDADKPIIVERAMYWNNRGVGTDTVGGFLD